MKSALVINQGLSITARSFAHLNEGPCNRNLAQIWHRFLDRKRRAHRSVAQAAASGDCAATAWFRPAPLAR